MLAHTVKGIIHFEMTGKKFNRIITITIPDGMDCEIVLDKREKVELKMGIESVDKGQTSYKLPTGKKLKFHLRYL